MLPEAPYRHWALSYPYPVRLALARNWPAAALSCKIFLSEVFRFQRREARRRGARAPKTGAISFTQAKGTTAIIHLALRLSDMRVDQVKVSTVKTGESFRNCETHKGILDIADRGYSNQA